MGARTCLVARATRDARTALAVHPVPDEAATVALVRALFPAASFGAPSRTNLFNTYARNGEVVAGCFPGLEIVVSEEVALDRPSQLHARFVAERGTTLLHAMHSVVDWCAFAIWEDGVLRRALSVSPDSGVIEDIGERLPFEAPYWDGLHPAVDPEEDDDAYPLPFHPLELGEAALDAFFGFQLEGRVDDALLDPGDIGMLAFGKGTEARVPGTRARRPWWKFW